MNENSDADAATAVRPVGTWIVAGFLLTAILLIWVLVAVVFHVRS